MGYAFCELAAKTWSMASKEGTANAADCRRSSRYMQYANRLGAFRSHFNAALMFNVLMVPQPNSQPGINHDTERRTEARVLADFYGTLINAHRELTFEESPSLNAKLVPPVNRVGRLAELKHTLHDARANTIDRQS